MKVIKFGGAVLKDLSGFRAMLEILKRNAGNKILLVVSAFGKSTSILTRAAHVAETGDFNQACAVAAECLSKYDAIACETLSHDSSKFNANEYLASVHEKLTNLLQGVSITRELTRRTLDAIVACGEDAALLTTELFLRDNHLSAAGIHASELISTDSNFGNAKPIADYTADNITHRMPKMFLKADIVVTQGFVAKDLYGEITTMGLESSNLTAAIFAKVLGIKELEIYTDVCGIRTADPKLHAGTKCFRKMPFAEARRAGLSGLKLVFPAMISQLAGSGTRILIKNAFEPDGEFTEISEEITAVEPADTLLLIERSPLVLYRDSSEDYKLPENAFVTYTNAEYKAVIQPETPGNLRGAIRIKAEIHLAFSPKGRQDLLDLLKDLPADLRAITFGNKRLSIYKEI